MAIKPVVVHVVGARPNFPKAAPVISAMQNAGVSQLVLHTGQHYDKNMSEVFLAELGMPAPHENLGVGPGTQVEQISEMLTKIERYLLRHGPALVVVYGDVNSTLAAALVGAKMGVAVAHVEAGLRSFDRSMPEEQNRVIADQLSDVLFATCPDAAMNLAREGIPADRVHFVGNTMIDTLMGKMAEIRDRSVNSPISDGAYALATIHRPSNVDSVAAAGEVARTLRGLSELLPIVIPLHPRGRAMLESVGLRPAKMLKIVEPLGYIDFLAAMFGARFVITDSGGVQEESTVLGVPCLTLRPNTERPITIGQGTNRLVNPGNAHDIATAVLERGRPARWAVPPLWDGRSSVRIAEVLVNYL